jgi:hypothetical protein
MCFSAQADLIGGVVVSAVGVDALRHVQSPRQLPVASLPLLLGGHLLIETFVWWGLEGRTSAELGIAAMWAYLVIAFVVLPPFVPLAIMAIEPRSSRRALLGVLAALGAGVAITLLAAMVRGPVGVELHERHLAYDVGLSDGLLIVALYVVATCGALLVSSHRHVVVFGAINLLVVVLLAFLNSSGFASLWCAWAAVTSVLIAAYLRSTAARQGRTTLRTTSGIQA